MLNEFLKSVVAVSGSVTPTGANGPCVLTGSPGNIFLFHTAAPVRLLKWGVLITANIASGAASGQLSLRFRPTIGSTASDSLLDTLTTGTTTYNAGTGLYRDPFTVSTNSTAIQSQVSGAGPSPDQGTFGVNSTPAQFILLPGQEWSVNVVTSPDTTGTGYIFVEYTLLPIARPSGYSAGTISTTGDTSFTDNLTRLAS